MVHKTVKSPLNNPASSHTYAAFGLVPPVKPVAVEHDKGAVKDCAYPETPARYLVHDDGSLFVRSQKPASFRACIHDLGHGQIEASVTPIYRWIEAEPLSPLALAHRAECAAVPVEPSQNDLDRKAADTAARSSRRACQKVRRLAKFKRLDTMWTLTYRENETDRAVMQRHHAAFVRRVKRIIPGFEYVTVFELQKRGAWHAHMAVSRIKALYIHDGKLVKSYDLFRSIWRSVIGGIGSFRNDRSGYRGRSVSKLACYLSKYLTKDIGSAAAKYQNSYQSSGRSLPDSIVLEVTGSAQDAALAAITLCFPEWASGRLASSPQLAHGGYFFTISPDK